MAKKRPSRVRFTGRHKPRSPVRRTKATIKELEVGAPVADVVSALVGTQDGNTRYGPRSCVVNVGTWTLSYTLGPRLSNGDFHQFSARSSVDPIVISDDPFVGEVLSGLGFEDGPDVSMSETSSTASWKWFIEKG